MAINLAQVPKVGRRSRRPQHTWNVRHRPWQIQPFMIAAVLPGETMKSLLMQARVVTDPIKNPLIGWWIEYYFFYVKHRDLNDRDHFTQMMLEQDYNLSSLNSAAKVETYHGWNGLDWVQKCVERITEEYFRDEDEAWNLATIGNLPAAHIAQRTWLDSVVREDEFGASDDVTISTAGDNAFTAREVDVAMRTWQFLRANQLTTMDYEDYLATYGVKPEVAKMNRPELIKFARNWTYPTNHIDPTTGAPTSACSWSISERADKDRFFREPGFIIGCTVARPKVYLSKQTGTVTGLMADAMAWLPAILRDDPYTSMRLITQGTGPLPSVADAYWIDVKDLLLYGEQFVNFAVTDTNYGAVALPTTALNKKYAAATDADAMFVSGSANLVRQDGVANLDILGALEDTTPQGIRG